MGVQHDKKRKKKRKKKKREKEKEKETNLSTLTGSLHYCTLLSKEFLLFFTVPISVEPVTPIRTAIAIHLMVSFAVHAFEDMRTWLTSNGGHTICFLIFRATPCFLSVVFGIMSSVTLGTPGDIRVTAKCRMTLLPTVFTLRNS